MDNTTTDKHLSVSHGNGQGQNPRQRWIDNRVITKTIIVYIANFSSDDFQSVSVIAFIYFNDIKGITILLFLVV